MDFSSRSARPPEKSANAAGTGAHLSAHSAIIRAFAKGVKRLLNEKITDTFFRPGTRCIGIRPDDEILYQSPYRTFRCNSCYVLLQYRLCRKYRLCFRIFQV